MKLRNRAMMLSGPGDGFREITTILDQMGRPAIIIIHGEAATFTASGNGWPVKYWEGALSPFLVSENAGQDGVDAGKAYECGARGDRRRAGRGKARVVDNETGYQ